MSSSSPWIYEPETGRWYVNERDAETGRDIRWYEDQLRGTSSSSAQGGSSTTVPRTPYVASSSHRSSSRTPHRRESVSYSTRGSNRESYPEPTQPQRPPLSSTHDRRSIIYNDPGGYGTGQDGRSTQSFEYGSASTSTGTGYPRDTSGYSQEYNVSRTTAPLERSAASMTSQMGAMSLGTSDRGTGYVASSQSLASPSYTTSPNAYSMAPGRSDDTRDYPSRNEPYPSNTIDSSREEMGSSMQTETRSAPPGARRHVAGTPGDKEKLDSRYQVRNHDYKKFFRPGRVFSTLWTVPASGTTNNNETFISVVKFGEKVHTKIRRFVVIKQKTKNCTCLPVTSYEGRGYKKPDIDLDDHGSIYTSKRPKTVPEIKKRALKVILSKGAEHLRDPSLINYGCPYTVETNVKVMDVGTLDADSLTLLEDYYHEVNAPPSGKPAQDPAALAGVGGAFNSPGAQPYGGNNRSSYAGHDRTSSFSSQPGAYRVPLQGQGYNNPSGYGPNTGYPPPLVSSSQYAISPSSPTDNRYSGYSSGGQPPTNLAYASTETSSSNARFSPTSDSGRGNYTTLPPYRSDNSQTAQDPYAADRHKGSRDQSYGRASQDTMGNAPSRYSPESQRGIDPSREPTTRSEEAETAYSASRSVAGGSSSYAQRTPPVASSTLYENPQSGERQSDNGDEDDGDEDDVVLPTRQEVEATRPPASSRSHRRESVSISSSSRHGGRDRARDDDRERPTGSSRHHGRSDRDRDRDRKERRR